jgi:hypothetical protein
MGRDTVEGRRGGPRVPSTVSVPERGAVSAEAAAALPVLVGVTLALVWLVSLAATQVRVVDAAREVARATARGDAAAAATAHGHRVAPEGTTFRISTAGDLVTVTAVAEVTGPGGMLAFLPGVTVRSEAVAAQEPR